MANYNAWIRTNYFTVTDEVKFKTVMSACQAEDTIHIFDDKQSDGSMKFGFGCCGNIYGLPVDENDEDSDRDMDLFFEALQELLPEGEAVIMTEIGYEKLRYLVGCCAVITKNDIQGVGISDKALELARNMLGNPEFTTKNHY